MKFLVSMVVLGLLIVNQSLADYSGFNSIFIEDGSNVARVDQPSGTSSGGLMPRARIAPEGLIIGGDRTQAMGDAYPIYPTGYAKTIMLEKNPCYLVEHIVDKMKKLTELIEEKLSKEDKKSFDENIPTSCDQDKLAYLMETLIALETQDKESADN